MGLTIHYKLGLIGAVEGVDHLQARDVVDVARKLALKFKRKGRVDAVGAIGFEPALRRFAREWRFHRVPGAPKSFTEEEIWPVAGWLFFVEVGRGCEPLLLGLCRYDRPGWRLHSFSKTQFAGVHGWEHFQRCHCVVIDLLAALRPLGFKVRINDEGEYWPRRSTAALRRNLGEMNAAIAGAAGALKDANEECGGPPVQSPIFAHPQFERLEAQGEAAGAGTRLRKALARK
jgi:hypothetical protein